MNPNNVLKNVDVSVWMITAVVKSMFSPTTCWKELSGRQPTVWRTTRAGKSLPQPASFQGRHLPFNVSLQRPASRSGAGWRGIAQQNFRPGGHAAERPCYRIPVR